MVFGIYHNEIDLVPVQRKEKQTIKKEQLPWCFFLLLLGHSIEQIRGHELFLSDPKPIVNYNGLFGM